jgi:hypothetical protein
MTPHRSRRNSARSSGLSLEPLEGRQLLTTFTVRNLLPAGPGSLRAAVVRANASPGHDTIEFAISGTIEVSAVGLPSLTDTVTIDGTSAPSFTGRPLVTVDFQGHPGFEFDKGSQGSVLRSLSIVHAHDAGVTLNASHITVQGNYIGLLADGKTAAVNNGDGVRINPSSGGNLIGNDDPVTSINYYDSRHVSVQPVSGWQGIRNGDSPNQYYQRHVEHRRPALRRTHLGRPRHELQGGRERARLEVDQRVWPR